MKLSSGLWKVFVAAAVTAAVFSPGSVVRAEGVTEWVSVASNGEQGNLDSKDPSLSGDGRYVAFESKSTNFGSNSAASDVYVHDRQTGVTSLISVDSSGVEVSGVSYSSAMSADGRYVAFVSTSQFVPEDISSTMDVYVHDLQTGATTMVSVDSNEEALSPTYNVQPPPAPSISADGQYVAFESPADLLVANDNNMSWDIFVRNRAAGTTSRASVTSSGGEKVGNSSSPSISGDGRFVAFSSYAILTNDDNNGTKDIFVRDRQEGTTTLISVSSSGVQGNGSSSQPSISTDGRYVSFTSLASNLVPVDNNSTYDVFVHDRQTGETKMASIDTDGRQVASTNYSSAISGDGRYVVFVSPSSSLVDGDTNGAWDIFVHDGTTGNTTRASLATDGTQANGDSVERPAISADGGFVAFESIANNLVSGDTNGAWDVFVHEIVNPAAFDASAGMLDIPEVQFVSTNLRAGAGTKAYQAQLKRLDVPGYVFSLAGARKMTASSNPAATFNTKTGVLEIAVVEVQGLARTYNVWMQKRPGELIFDMTKARKN